MRTKLFLLLLISPAMATARVQAGSASWNLNPAFGDWNTAANWTPNTVPNGSADVATFGVSNNTAVSLSANATVDRAVFNPGASAFTITLNPSRTLTISGVGVTNSSGVTQNFSTISDAVPNFGQVTFAGSATAGDGNVFTNHASKNVCCGAGGVLFTANSVAGTSTFINKADEVGPGGLLAFLDSASADHGTFSNEAGDAHGSPGGSISFLDNATAGNGLFTMHGPQTENGRNGQMLFFGTSTAGNGTFLCEGSGSSASFGGSIQIIAGSTAGNGNFTIDGATTSGGRGGYILIGGTATGGNATITLNGGTIAGASGGTLSISEASFGDQPSAGNAILIANGGVNGGAGGTIAIGGGTAPPDGGTARMELFGNGNLDISARQANQNLTTGSIEGDGMIFLGQVQLSVGRTNLDTVFSGIIQDGGIQGGIGGSLTKSGTGQLTLSGVNTYTGGTTVKAGTLLVSNRTGSATGTGTVVVNMGTLGGGGTIAGSVTIGSSGASFLAPASGSTTQTTLTLQSSLTLQSAATYTYTFRANKKRAQTDIVFANGVTINGATFTLQGTTQGRMKLGTILTVISNTSATPISGTFNNLVDGAILTVSGNNLQASYHGGDGNDLTLTVVP